MTVKEYNREFLPRIEQADYIISNLEHIVEHMDKNKVDKKEIWRMLGIYGWSEEVRETLLKALECYKIYEGLEKLER